MAKEDPKRLFSKVAKFVRNPLKDWSELDDATDTAAPETGYSREMLKEMIERRQRNDFVRRREFDMLRKMRRREAAGDRDAAAPVSIDSTSGKNDGRALTLKKIDEIEEQMSQQWWKGRPPGAPGEQPAGGLASAHSRAYADTVPGGAPPSDLGIGDSTHGPNSVDARPSRLVGGSAIEEASIRFAHGDDPGAEAILLQALAPETPTADHDDIWLALLDLYRATGDAEKFTATATRYAQRVKGTAPEWMSLRMLARDAQAVMAVAPVPAPAWGGADWRCPAQLSRSDLADLTRALGAAGSTWTLDWSALTSISPDTAAPLRTLFAHWTGMPVLLRFGGGSRLLAVLEKATPVSERGNEVVWWQLRMDALRMMNLPDDFELVALNYCITYEVSPPPWEDAQCRFEKMADAAPAAAPALAFGPDHDDALAEPGPHWRAALAGDLVGESLPTWHRLDAELADESTPTISCAALVRIDFAAAGTLLNWVMARDARGQRVHFVDAHRLIAPFFGVIGIADHATVAVRPN